jgi:hypothetical protein
MTATSINPANIKSAQQVDYDTRTSRIDHIPGVGLTTGQSLGHLRRRDASEIRVVENLTGWNPFSVLLYVERDENDFDGGYPFGYYLAEIK